jgi:hypothetical protein
MPGKGVRNRFRAELSETVPDTFSRQGCRCPFPGKDAAFFGIILVHVALL